MPSELTLNKKKEYVSQLREKVENSVAGVVVSYQGISVADDTSLRKELREAGIDYKVVKNTMLRFAEMCIRDRPSPPPRCAGWWCRPQNRWRRSPGR